MKSMMNQNSWANKTVALFTSLALVMTVAFPTTSYAMEVEAVEAQDETTALVATEDETTEAVEEAVETNNQEAPAADVVETPVVEEIQVETQIAKNEAAQAVKTKADEAEIAEGKVEEPKTDSAVEPAEAETMTKEAPATKAASTTEAKVLTEAASKAAAAKSAVTLGQFQVQGDEGAYAYAENVLTIMGDVIVSTTAKTNERIVVANDATVTLHGVEIEASDAAAAITVESGVNAIISLFADTVNTVVGGKDHAGIEVAWQSESNFANLAIQGEGELNAKGGAGNGGAGIGGSYVESDGLYGNITIESGKVTAEGTSRAAGIGSSNNRTNYGNVDTVRGDIVINGGDVTAIGVGNGAGIGGGNHMSSGTIVINGGTVYAEGDSGIGSGLGSSSGADKGPGHFWADVTINGGKVVAYATDNMGAGIGGGMYSDAYVTINGGDVTASVNLNGKAYQGGAGIGGGYQGAAIVAINGGKVTAYGGNGSAGIGNGALAATTTSKNYSEDKGWNGTKNVRTGAPEIAIEDSKVEITGGTVVAYGGYAGAGIGSGNSSEWSNIIISGGDVTAIGYASSEEAMEGAAGIGSGASWVTNKVAYMKETIENITITGGNVIAIGGWGAAGIGSGAKNGTADSVVIDAENANVQAYADGTKFAIDTLADDSSSNVDISGNVLQGTFVHEYTDDEGNNQGTEGLKSIILKNDATGEVKQLTLMPDGYRSYATDVAASGVYSIYTDSNAIGGTGEDANGNGAYFSVYATDKWEGDEEGNKPVTYGVVTDELSNYLYLFPVKTVVVETAIEIVGASDEAAEELASSINQTFNFAIHTHKGGVIDNEHGTPWIQAIEVVGGIAQGSAYFANMNDGAFEIWEVDENGESLAAGTQYGDLVLTAIRTQHGEGTDNNAEISKGIWKDVVRIVNVFTAIPVEPEAPESVKAPEDAEVPESPADPQGSDDQLEPAAPVAPATPVGPTTPVTPSNPTTLAGSTTPVAPIAATAGNIAEAAALTVAPVAMTAPVSQETVVEDPAPIAGSVEAEAIADDANPLADHEHGAECWVHWWMLLGMLITAVYTVVVAVRRASEDDEQDDADQNDAQNENARPFGNGTTLQPATIMIQEA